MKLLLTGVWVALIGVSQGGQDRLPLDEAQRYAKVCVELLGSLTDTPINLDVDVEKPCAVRGEGGGAMIVPDKSLSKERLAKLGQDVVPVGQLWLRKWTPVVAGKPVAKDRLRVVTLRVDDKDRPMPLLLLGVRKHGDKGLELVGYARDSEPILALPLKRIEFIQALPVELEWQRGDKNADSLTLSVLGQYKAVLPIARE
jgi:hypothetical protein